MQIGCNYSSQLVSILTGGYADVDWIKISTWEEYEDQVALARPLRPVLLHVLPRAGIASLNVVPLSVVSSALIYCGSPHIALHLAARPSDWDHPVTDKQVIERLVDITTSYATQLPVPLLVENMTFYGTSNGYVRCSSDPGVIWTVCERANVGLLLDVAHARVAASHRREDIHAYLAALPLAKVREIHVNGPSVDPCLGLRDCHQSMQQEDFDLLDWLLDRTCPDIVTLEYGGTGEAFALRSDLKVLQSQLKRLDGLLKN